MLFDAQNVGELLALSMYLTMGFFISVSMCRLLLLILLGLSAACFAAWLDCGFMSGHDIVKADPCVLKLRSASWCFP